MKVTVLMIMMLFALSLLAGCGPQKKDETAPPAEETIETAEFLPEEIDEMIDERIEESDEAPLEAQTDAELEALLDAVRTRVFPGTAGSSLSAAACAAKLADFFTEHGTEPDAVESTVQSMLAALDGEDKALFEMQLDAVAGAFSALTGENGAGLLEDCGYESAHFPWEGERVKNCFVALPGTD